MIPTKQTVLHDPANGLKGNCFSAVLASLLHLPIEDIPLFVDPETWNSDLNAWLRPFGMAYIVIGVDERFIADIGITGMWHEVSGYTPRFKDVMHSCVAKDCKLVFDPHPDDSGLIGSLYYGVFIVLEPWRKIT